MAVQGGWPRNRRDSPIRGDAASRRRRLSAAPGDHQSLRARHRNPDFAAIAQAYGIASVSITSSEGMADKFRFALNCKGPVLVHCQVDPEEDLLPMLLGGHTLDDMSNETSF